MVKVLGGYAGEVDVQMAGLTLGEVMVYQWA